ncbi:hypothetical protein [Methylococcus sp. EFPC2]|uniref:hypothetical protein n=1 Tax=Methylococcus sp. EFPC2 TaxID=2812648 RepID=UPI00196820CF|nr:hypothetical protein [Methylococcus sp. EFPC2]QSA98317.1 hypothetical protein JWZ97_05760 [Methylococcus sp. EFPC2]
MIRNPELQRNIWLELTPHRLIATPVVLLLLLALIVSTNENGWHSTASITAAVIFVFATVLWGGRRAYDSIVDEVRAHTWDTQRMSALGPWQMTWGKLLGSNLYNWYTGAYCLAVLLFTFDDVSLGSWQNGSALRFCLLLVLSALFVQGAGLLSGLTAARSGRTIKPSRNLPITVLGLLLLLWLERPLAQHTERPVEWYGFIWQGHDFVLGSLAVFAAWVWFGAYRLMSDLLAVRSLPWGALSFVVFLSAYVCGFIDDALWGYASRYAALGTAIGGGAVYVEAWKERRDWIAVQRFLRAWRGESWLPALQATPSWLVVAAFTLLMSLVTGFLPANRPYYIPDISPVSQHVFDMLTMSPLVFTLLMFRDVGLLYFFSLGERPERAPSTTLVYLAVLYAVLPSLLNLAGLGFLAFPAVYPLHHGGSWVGITVAAGHVAVVAGLLRQRLARI